MVNILKYKLTKINFDKYKLNSINYYYRYHVTWGEELGSTGLKFSYIKK